VRVYPEQWFCRSASRRCVVSEGERIYYGSDNHESPLGSSIIVHDLAGKLRLEPEAAAGGQ
jgi:hypothetical protein